MKKLNMKQLVKGGLLTYLLVLLAGIVAGRLLFRLEHEPGNNSQVSVEAKAEIWTCAMHPQVRLDHKGKCPICGMELIPLESESSGFADPGAVTLSEEAASLAKISTTIIRKESPVHEIHLYGKTGSDERNLKSLSSHISGRIEKLMVNFTGERVKEGQIIATIYSPELITAQQEFLETLRTKESEPGLFQASRERLRQWKLTDKQINEIETSGKIKRNIEIVSNMSGTVTEKKVSEGAYISAGSVLFGLADLSHIWVMFDAYEHDLSYLYPGEKVMFTASSVPGKEYTGVVNYVDPVLDPVTRVARVRVETGNRDGKLKPGMFVSGTINASLPTHGPAVVIPKSAVLWTGKRSVVYVKDPYNKGLVYSMREVVLGPRAGSGYIVTGGLKEGEELVTNGAFSIDAAAQLQNKPNMLSRTAEAVPGAVTVSFHVAGNCDMCRDRIEKAALSVEGVKSASWNEKTGTLLASYDRELTDRSSIEKTIAKAGHDTEHFKADDVTYSMLPDCCRYRK